jgi:hypothetical protein
MPFTVGGASSDQSFASDSRMRHAGAQLIRTFFAGVKLELSILIVAMS